MLVLLYVPALLMSIAFAQLSFAGGGGVVRLTLSVTEPVPEPTPSTAIV